MQEHQQYLNDMSKNEEARYEVQYAPIQCDSNQL